MDEARLQPARDHASVDVPVVAPGLSKSGILRAMAGRKYASATHVAVCEDGVFRGIIRIEDLLSADEETRAADMMDPDPQIVASGMDQEVAAWKAVQHGETALAVVDGRGRSRHHPAPQAAPGLAGGARGGSFQAGRIPE